MIHEEKTLTIRNDNYRSQTLPKTPKEGPAAEGNGFDFQIKNGERDRLMQYNLTQRNSSFLHFSLSVSNNDPFPLSPNSLTNLKNTNRLIF